jgi:hypothetical protein
MKMAKAAGANTISPHDRAPSTRIVVLTRSRPPMVESPACAPPLPGDFPFMQTLLGDDLQERLSCEYMA